MIKISFAGNWKMSSKDLLNLYSRQTPNNSGVWNDIVGTICHNDADFIVVQDETHDIIDNSKVIFFGKEPKHVKLFSWNKKCYAKFHHNDLNTWMPQTWQVGISYNDLLTNKFEKNKNISVIDTGKLSLIGHKNRVNFIKKLKNDIDIDIYGKLNNKILPEKDKKNGLINYKYYLSIENGKTDFYFSEKFVDALLCWCVPFYWGCSKINEFFPEKSYVNINIYDYKKSLFKIKDTINSNYIEENLNAISEARHLILNKYNIWPTIEMAVKNKKIL